MRSIRIFPEPTRNPRTRFKSHRPDHFLSRSWQFVIFSQRNLNRAGRGVASWGEDRGWGGGGGVRTSAGAARWGEGRSGRWPQAWGGWAARFLGSLPGSRHFLYCTSIGRKKSAEFGLANGDWRMGTMSRSRVCLSPFVSPHSSVKIPGRIIGGHFGAVAEGAGLCGCCAGDCGPASMEILRRCFFSASLPISAVFWFCFRQPFGDERAAEQNTAEIGRNAEGCGWLSLRPGPRR